MGVRWPPLIKGFDEWKRTKITRPPDCIISSDYTNKVHEFKPSCNKYNEPLDMFYLLGNEYQRRWSRELDTFNKEQANTDTSGLFILRKCRRRLRDEEKIAAEASSKKKRTFKNVKSRYFDCYKNK